MNPARPAAPELQAEGRVSAAGCSLATVGQPYGGCRGLGVGTLSGAGRCGVSAVTGSAKSGSAKRPVSRRAGAQTSALRSAQSAQSPVSDVRRRSKQTNSALSASLKSPRSGSAKDSPVPSTPAARKRTLGSFSSSSTPQPAWVLAEQAAGADLSWALANLTPTERAGVWRNAAGLDVDANGAGLDVQALSEQLELSEEERVLGRRAQTPAEVMKYAALNRKLPLGLRLTAAKDAAPYYDRKQPQALDGGVDPTGTPQPIRLENLAGLSTEELTQLRALLAKSAAAAEAEGPAP